MSAYTKTPVARLDERGRHRIIWQVKDFSGNIKLETPVGQEALRMIHALSNKNGRR